MKTANDLEKAIAEGVEEIETLLKKQHLASIKLNESFKRDESLRTAYKALTGKESQVRKFNLDVILEVKPTRGANARLADVIEAVLQESGPLEVNELISRLRGRDVRLSLSNPRNVVVNTVNRDKERFGRLADGRIALREK